MGKLTFAFVSETEKEIFHRMVRVGLEIQPSKKVMSFWMFLDSHNFNQFYHKISICDEKFFKSLYAEAEIALIFLASNSSSISQDFCPLTSQLLSPLSLKEIILNKEKVNKEISLIYDTFCCDVFEVKLEEKTKNNMTEEEKLNLALNSKLNPFAKEWSSSEAHRSLFMTFSRGYPITRRQIINFFNWYVTKEQRHRNFSKYLQNMVKLEEEKKDQVATCDIIFLKELEQRRK
ncbi:hypothetical protein A4A49_52929 [Nicotiana attenuata]|uniref:Uncharacterized protein n=1 Tax=Nicotiana attenuata TaxID=49451 RepID=A0A314KYH5_NICAT|nr:hypothetical protein A4A49_52929 [Nicotiana attenuata]